MGKNRTRALLYGAMLLLMAVIFSTAGIIEAVRKLLAERFGAGVYECAYGPAVLVVFAMMGRVVRSKRAVAPRLVLLAGLGAFTVLQMTTLRFAVEKIHYLEYGLLAFLAAAAFLLDFGAGASLGLAVLTAYCTGVADEALQSLHPDRVADIADVVLNVKAGLLGALFFGVLRYPEPRDFRVTPREGVFLSGALLLALVATFFFVERVYGYGHLIRDPGGVAFYSSFDRDELSRADATYSAAPVWDRADRKGFADEAARHHFQREFYRTHRFSYAPNSWYIDYGRAFRENLVLERHYPAWLDAGGGRWDDSTRAAIEKRSQAFRDTGWVSRVKSRTIVSVPPARLRALFGAAGVLLSAGLLFSIRRRKA